MNKNIDKKINNEPNNKVDKKDYLEALDQNE